MNQIQQLVDETINSLDDLEPVKANPFLYTRIAQRMRNRQQRKVSGKLMPVLATALVLFICLNLLSIVEFRTDNSGADGRQTSSSIESFANDYGLQEEAGL